jgi:hypothetical protein
MLPNQAIAALLVRDLSSVDPIFPWNINSIFVDNLSVEVLATGWALPLDGLLGKLWATRVQGARLGFQA